MFTEMIQGIREGRRPSPADLKRRLDLAIVKKGGILQQPRNCWSADTKINPATKHMLWAASILGDMEALNTVVGMVEIEVSSGSDNQDFREILSELFRELPDIARDARDNDWLTNAVNSAVERIGIKF